MRRPEDHEKRMGLAYSAFALGRSIKLATEGVPMRRAIAAYIGNDVLIDAKEFERLQAVDNACAPEPKCLLCKDTKFLQSDGYGADGPCPDCAPAPETYVGPGDDFDTYDIPTPKPRTLEPAEQQKMELFEERLRKVEEDVDETQHRINAVHGWVSYVVRRVPT